MDVAPAVEHMRRADVARRSRVVQADILALRHEQRELPAAARVAGRRASLPDAKALTQRRIHTATRPLEARSELPALVAERRSPCASREAA